MKYRTGEPPTSKPTPPKRVDDAAEYYRYSIHPYENFNKIEITLSHLFREPNPLLDGSTFGGALFRFFKEQDWILPRITEIGGGLGDVMRRILDADDARAITSCRMLDISPRLRKMQGEAVKHFEDVVDIRVEHGDCDAISDVLTDHDQFILCNGVLADLSSLRIDTSDNLEELLGGDPSILSFAKQHRLPSPFYLPVGSFRFLDGLKTRMTPASIAFVTEYSATKLNQPSWFGNHFECGVDFELLQSFAREIGFKATLIDVAEAIGFDAETPLLTMDVFTMPDLLGAKVSPSMDLARLREPLPVAAYSKATFERTLAGQLPESRLSALVEAMESYFHPLASPKFDRKNPTTWTYKALALRRA